MPETPETGVSARRPMAQLPLETERLALRVFVEADAARIAHLLDDPVMAESLMVIPHPFVVYDARTLIRAAWRRLTTGHGFDLAIALRDAPGQLIGSVGIGLHDNGRRGELGFWVGRSDWGRGYASEAAARLVRFARASLGAREFTATAAIDNAASIRVLTRLGFSEIGRSTREIPSTGAIRKVILFADTAGGDR